MRRTEVETDQLASRSRNLDGDVPVSHLRHNRESPVPVDDVYYVYHDLQNHINTPEIVPQTSNLLREDQQSKLPMSSAVENREPKSEKPVTSEFACSGEPYFGENRSKNPSKFDSKFRDYVSDACQAESAHRAYTTGSYRGWPNLSSSTYAQKSKSLQSSENIQVRSAGTPFSSTAASSKTSSLDTAVYISKHYRHPAEPNHANSVADGPARVSSVPLRSRSLSSKLEADLHKGTSILNNAKRLLSTSPLHNVTKPILTGAYRHQHSDIKALPEYKPRYFEHKSYPRASGYVHSESSKSDMSVESFLPLPLKLQNHQCLLSNESPRAATKTNNELVSGRTSEQRHHHHSSGTSEVSQC